MPTLNIRIKYSLLVFFCCLSTIGFSQTQVIGKVVNASGEALIYTNVVLFSAADTVFIKGAVSNQDGEFIFSSVASGDYFCEASMVGFTKARTEVFAVADESGEIELGETVLSDNLELKEVEIFAQKSMIEVRPDKIVFNVAATPSVSGLDALELLRRAPGVNVDMDNNIALLGKSGVRIFINGRPTRLSGTDLANLLQNIGSDNIEDLEIISNPSSKYEAEGDAGIININLKKNVATGFNGSATASFTQGDYFRNNQSVTLNYGGEKVKATLGVSRVDNESYDNFTDTKIQNGFSLDLLSDQIQNFDGYTVTSGLEYTMSEKHSLSFAGTAILNANDDDLESTTNISLLETGSLTEILESQTLLDRESTNYNFNVNYQWKLNSTSKLGADLSYGDFNSEGNTYQPNTFFESDGNTAVSVLNNEFDSDTYIDLWSGKLDYEKEWEGWSLSVGSKSASIVTDNRFTFYNVLDSEPILDPSQSNDFIYEEKVAALYAIADVKLSPLFNMSAGLRVENTASRGRLESEEEIENNDVKRNYTDFFPNVSVSFNDNKDHALSLSVGRRITRPNYQNLNPFEAPLSELTAWKGNPFLSPSYAMNYQLTYAFKKKLTITNSYSETTDFFASIFEISGDQSNVIIPRNMQKTTQYSLSASYPFEVSPIWDFIAFADGGYSTFDGDLEGTIIDLELLTWSFRVQNSISLPLGVKMDLTYRISSDWIWRGSIGVEGNQRLDFGFRKSFLDGQLEVRLTASDAFRTDSEYFYEGEYGGIAIDGVRIFDNQRFGMGATWNFGNQKLKTMRRSEGAMDDELNRISN